MYSEVYFPPHVRDISDDLKNLILGLLEKDSKKRFGCGKFGIGLIKRHPWFYGTNWEQILKKEIQPFFLPSFENETDLKFFESKFTEMDPDSSDENSENSADLDNNYFYGIFYFNNNIFNLV